MPVDQVLINFIGNALVLENTSLNIKCASPNVQKSNKFKSSNFYVTK